MQGVRVDEGAVAGGGLGAVVEDPDNLGTLVLCRGGFEGRAYRDHGQQDVASCCCLEGGYWRVDERIDRGSGEDEAGSKEADDLWVSAGAVNK